MAHRLAASIRSRGGIIAQSVLEAKPSRFGDGGKLMDIYSLTEKGRATLEHMRDKLGITWTADYQVLEYLYENGTGTDEHIVSYTGLHHSEVVAKLNRFRREGDVEVSEKL